MKCFPRTRGDGPSTSRPVASKSLFPPHARGWTHVAEEGQEPGTVSPARAGMDHDGRHDGNDGRGFPRTRGDGPLIPVTLHIVSRFPPHARGWTLVHRERIQPLGVSPARAGMDRLTCELPGTRRSFPRTRGDGPFAASSRMRSWVFPPHARGWTGPSTEDWSSRNVSPARAGMDPPLTRDCPTGRCFPRTRGDGPVRPIKPDVPEPFPPHARGWTQRRRGGIA